MKKEVAKAEEEKQLIWRIQEKPSGLAVAKLVEHGVIDKAEARAILFREEVKQSDEVEALKEMVNTLQEMVKDLLSRQNTQITRVIEVPNRITPYWQKYWTAGSLSTGAVGTSGNTTYTLSI